MVPMEMLTSMLLEPSSGSKTTTYLRAGRSRGPRSVSISSLAIIAQCPRGSSDGDRVSLAKASSFCTSSPWTLVSPV